MENVAAEMRRSRPHVVLGFLGCMAQSRGQELIDRLPDVDLVIGTQKFHRAADYLDDILAGRRDQVVDVGEEPGSEATIREHLRDGNRERNPETAVASHDAEPASGPLTPSLSPSAGASGHDSPAPVLQNGAGGR